MYVALGYEILFTSANSESGDNLCIFWICRECNDIRYLMDFDLAYASDPAYYNELLAVGVTPNTETY